MNKKQIILNELNKLEAMRVSEEIRANNALLLAREISEFRELDNEKRKLQIEVSKLPISSPNIKNLNKQIELLNQKAQKVLEKNNFDLNNLSIKFKCNKCHDTGYIDGQMCECLKHNVQNALIELSGINSKLNFDFSKSDKNILLQNPTLDKIYRFAHSYCDEYPNNKKQNLIFYGNVGTGKTFLLECIANELLDKMHYVVFTTAYDVCATMIKAFNSSFSERNTILSPLFESDLLIIDDLGTEPIFHESTLTNFFTLINERQRNNKAYIISTNLSPEQIDDRYGNRIKSRIYNLRNTIPIQFDSLDLRLKK